MSHAWFINYLRRADHGVGAEDREAVGFGAQCCVWLRSGQSGRGGLVCWQRFLSFHVGEHGCHIHAIRFHIQAIRFH